MSDKRQVAGDRMAAARKSRACHVSPVTRHIPGFTLVEMLVVISILGILAALTVPALKNLGKANAAMSASRQLLDGVGHARQLAIANHTTVYMVFVPTNFWVGMSSAQRAMPVATNLCDQQLSGYTFVAYGTVGDQPGQHAWHYLGLWQALPEGSFIPLQKFALPSNQCYTNNNYPVYGFNTNNTIPFPTETAASGVLLPCIAFNYLGQLTTDGQNPASRDEYIPLARGSVFPAMDPSSKVLQFSSPIVSETPPGNSASSAYNIVDVDPLTGRATLLFQKVQ